MGRETSAAHRSPSFHFRGRLWSEFQDPSSLPSPLTHKDSPYWTDHGIVNSTLFKLELEDEAYTAPKRCAVGKDDLLRGTLRRGFGAANARGAIVDCMVPRLGASCFGDVPVQAKSRQLLLAMFVDVQKGCGPKQGRLSSQIGRIKIWRLFCATCRLPVPFDASSSCSFKMFTKCVCTNLRSVKRCWQGLQEGSASFSSYCTSVWAPHANKQLYLPDGDCSSWLTWQLRDCV